MKTFWHLLVWTMVAWYSCITLLVAVRGFRDIRTMLERLKSGDSLEENE
jgi:hypothetical protein